LTPFVILQDDYDSAAEEQLQKDIALSEMGVERRSQRLAAKQKPKLQLYQEVSPFSDSDDDEDQDESISETESQVRAILNYF